MCVQGSGKSFHFIRILSSFCKKRGWVCWRYKSEKAASEIEQAGKAIALLGGRVGERIEFTLPDSDIYRSLYVIEKTERTPGKYPRKAGLPSKEPL